MTDVRTLVIKVTVDADKAEENLDDLNDAQDETGVKAIALGGFLANMATKLVEVGVEAAKAGAALLSDLVFGTAEAADEVAKSSAQLAINAQGLQRLRGAAALTGGDTATLDKGIRTLTKGLADAAQKGVGPASEGLAALGLEVEDLDAFLAAGDVEGAIGAIGDAFNGMGDSAQKNASLLKLFGSAGSKLRPLIESGSEGVREMGAQIQATGSVIEGEALGQFEAMVDASFLLDQQITGITNTIAIGLAPAVTEMGGLTQAWVADNQDFIDQDLPAILTEVGTALVETLIAVADWIKAAQELARDVGRLHDDYQAFIDDNQTLATAVTTLINPVEALADAFFSVVEGIAEAIGLGEEFKDLIDDITPGQDAGNAIARGKGVIGRQLGPQFAGGGSALLGRAPFDEAAASGDTSKLAKIAADPKFSDSDRAAAATAAEGINQRTAFEAADRASQEAAQRAQAVDQSRQRSAGSRGAGPAKPAPSRGGGGGGGPAEVSIEDLIGIGAPAGSGSAPAIRSAASALSGTILNTQNIDNSVSVEIGEINTPAVLPGDVAGEVAGEIRGVAEDLARQNREAFKQIAARRNVGP